MKEDISKRIKQIRNNLNMNKNQFANFLEVSPQFYGNVESGKHYLSIEKIILLSKKANVSTDYILLGKRNIADETIMKEISNITQKQLDTCFRIICNIVNMLNENL